MGFNTLAGRRDCFVAQAVTRAVDTGVIASVKSSRGAHPPALAPDEQRGVWTDACR
jgi:hypothetical protein